MGWNVRYYHRRAALSWEETVFDLINGLIAAGAQVYGSSDGVSFDNSGAGAVNYWSAQAVVDAADAWLRLRWPVVDGVSREMCIQRTGTNGQYSIYWSSDGTGFVTGASTTVRPSAADEQYTAQNLFMLPSTYDYPAGGDSVYSTLITGDAAEGYSFIWLAKSPDQIDFDTVIFMDVLRDVPAANADADPCIYGTSDRGNLFPGDTHFHSFFADTTINNADDNIAGWFRKGEADEAWVAYPISEWGTSSTSTGSSEGIAREETRIQERPRGWYEYVCYYARSSQRFSSELGFKGKSRLFGTVAQMCHVGPNVDSSRRHIGHGITLPWDGTTEAREL